MKKFQEVILKTDTETIENYTSDKTKLNKYDAILLKGNNINIKFERILQKIKIPLIWTKSLYTICKMSKVIPEETVLFSLYLMDKNVNENEALNVNETNNKKEKKRIPIPDNFKESILDSLIKNGDSIAKDPAFYYKTWKNLYKLLFIFPVFIIVGLIIQIVKYQVVLFALIELINYLLIVLLLFTAILGNNKMEKKYIQEWGTVNLMLLLMICISVISLLSCLVPSIGGKVFELLNSGKLLIIPFYLCLCFILCTLLFLNIKMNSFYEKYNKEEQEGKLLVDIES